MVFSQSIVNWWLVAVVFGQSIVGWLLWCSVSQLVVGCSGMQLVHCWLVVGSCGVWSVNCWLVAKVFSQSVSGWCSGIQLVRLLLWCLVSPLMVGCLLWYSVFMMTFVFYSDSATLYSLKIFLYRNMIFWPIY